MASGCLGKAAPVANSYTTVYTVPATTVSTINIAVVNKGSADARVRVAISNATSPMPEDYVEYDAPVPANGGVLERNALVVGAGENVIVYDDMGTCSYRVMGFEGAQS